MHPQASAPAFALDVDGAGAPLQHAALSACSQAFVHSTSEVTKLYMAPPHASRSSRSRVRPRPGHAVRAPWRTLLVPVGGAGTRPFSVETKLASAVMAGDDNIEQLSRMMTKRGAAASTAWGLGQSSSSSAGSRGRSSDHRDKRKSQRRTQRPGEEKVVESDSAAEDGSSGGAGTATAAAISARRGKQVNPPTCSHLDLFQCVDNSCSSLCSHERSRSFVCMCQKKLVSVGTDAAGHRLRL